jgi:predicted small lipoprotein YifL
MIRRLTALLLACAVVASLAACGRKNPPEAPPGQEDTFPRTYPYVGS